MVNPMSHWPIYVVFAVVVFMIVLETVWLPTRRVELLNSWATRNEVRLVAYEHRLFLRGPFFWTTSNLQLVYRVTVEEAGGHKRLGWVRLGSWCFGLLSNRVVVRWDE